MAKIYLRKVKETSFCSYKNHTCYFHRGFCAAINNRKYDGCNCWVDYVFIRVYPENDFKIPE